ncbi:MAG TPA: AI-2E family transporter [Terriglobales bacterium]|nr:AI-2E family transporter [Terriglobales bacterium]
MSTITHNSMPDYDQHSSPPKVRSLRSDIIFTIGLLVLLGFAWAAREVLMLIFVSALFAVVLSPAIDAIRKIHIGHWWPDRVTAILIIIVIATVGFGSFLIFAVPPMYNDLLSASTYLPQRIAEVNEKLHRFPLLPTFDPNALGNQLSESAGGTVGLFKGLATGLFMLFSWMILTAYFILDGQSLFYWFLSFFSEPQRGRLRSTMLRAEQRIRHWLVGQGLLMLILGVSAGITFWLMHVKYALFLGVMAGVLNIVPFAGPFLSFVMSSSIAALDSWSKFLGVVGFYFLYQQIENAILVPKIMKMSVDLPPLAVIIALFIGGSLAGMIGALIAVPTAAVLGVLLDEYFVRVRPFTGHRSEEAQRARSVAHH